jgi:peptidoglycan/LPS O-acetylase OafA/YrhL
VIVYHTTGLQQLHVLLPAIGVMYALAGSLMASSLDRRPWLPTLGSRIRRLLPPVWLYGAVVLLFGLEATGPHEPLWSRALFWLIPLRDPSANIGTSGLVDTLWYLRTYLWLVLLSPLLLRAFRRAWPVVLLAPFVLLPVATLVSVQPWPGDGLILNLLTYGGCWLLGFAARDGLLARLRPGLCVAVAAGLSLAAFGVYLLPGSRGDTVRDALASAAVVLLILRWRPRLHRLSRIRWLTRTVAVVNARAVTIYLWHDLAIVLAGATFRLFGLPNPGSASLPVVLLLTAIAMFLVGWVEDLAAGRPPALLPKAGDAVPARDRTPVPEQWGGADSGDQQLRPDPEAYQVFGDLATVRGVRDDHRTRGQLGQ